MALEAEQIALALPGYEVGPQIGRGAWGQVLSGRHRALHRDVAIKQLPRAFAADPSVKSRFQTEGRLLASLDHPHIVPVFDFVEQDDLCLLVMELLPGGTVWSRFTSNGFTAPAACATILAAASGLHAAHLKSVLHRDVKPENLMFSGAGVLKVTDFGIAKVVGGDSTLATRAGEVVGTPAYIAPEQARGAALSPATDVYALGTMLYELLSGQLPFADDGDAMALLFKHAYEEPVPLAEKAPGTSTAIVGVVMRSLATDPAQRFPSAESFAMALAEESTSVWGPGWLAAEGVPVMGAASVVAITERLTAGPGILPAVPAGGPAGPAGPGPTPPAGAGQVPPSPPTMARQPAKPQLQRARSTVIRPRVADQGPGAGRAGVVDLEAASVADLVPLQNVVKAPPSGRLPLLVAVTAVAAAAVLALTGLAGSPALGGQLGRASVRVDGVELVAGATVPLDLSRPVTVDVDGSSTATATRVLVLVDGFRTFKCTAALTGTSGARTARADLAAARYALGGDNTAEVELLAGGTGQAVIGWWKFGARLAQPAWETGAAAVFAILGLFSLAYIEQFIRSLWRGRRRVTATAGLGLMSGLLCTALLGGVWLAGLRQPTLLVSVACTALGVVAGLAAAVAAAQAGRSRRLKRRSARGAESSAPVAGPRRAA